MTDLAGRKSRDILDIYLTTGPNKFGCGLTSTLQDKGA